MCEKYLEALGYGGGGDRRSERMGGANRQKIIKKKRYDPHGKSYLPPSINLYLNVS